MSRCVRGSYVRHQKKAQELSYLIAETVSSRLVQPDELEQWRSSLFPCVRFCRQMMLASTESWALRAVTRVNRPLSIR